MTSAASATSATSATSAASATLGALGLKAAAGTPSEVEAALSRFRGSRTIAAAASAARIALESKRWDNLAYLADFLYDVTSQRSPTGGDTVDVESSPNSSDELSDLDEPFNLTEHVVPVEERIYPLHLALVDVEDAGI
jgi:hypothetical protein